MSQPRLALAVAQQRDRLLRLVSDGMTRTAACKHLGIPSDAVTRWIRNDEEFAQQWRVARQEQIATLADELITISDEPCDSMEAVQRNRLRVDTRKWLMSKWAPRQYGDKLHTDHTHTVGVILLPTLNVGDAKQVTLKDVANLLPKDE